MRRAIYVITDNKAQDIVGPVLHTMAHEAVAIRLFVDVATSPNSGIAKHPADFQLERLGYLEEDLSITPDRRIILTGSAWAASLGEQQ